MLTVILTILKVIGIIIAVLVGLILLVVLLVGFVPIRYKASGEYPAEGELNEDVISRRKRDALMSKVKTAELEEGENPEKEKKPLAIKAEAVVSWLLHIVHVSFKLDSTGYILTARLFGLFKIYSNDPETVKKKEEKQKKKEKKQRKKEEKERLKAEKKKSEEKDDQKTDKPKQEKISTEEAKTEESKTENLISEEKKDSDDSEKASANEKDDNGKSVSESSSESSSDSSKDDAFDSLDDDEDEEKKGIIGKIKNIYNKLAAIHKKVEYVKDMKDDKRVRRGISYAKEKLFLIIKRILPKKLEGRVAFGMDDPATTGYITGGACLFYALWHDHFSLEPDFENKRLEVDAKLKGRIILALLVIPAAKVWFNKDIKHIRRRVGKLKNM